MPALSSHPISDFLNWVIFQTPKKLAGKAYIYLILTQTYHRQLVGLSVWHNQQHLLQCTHIPQSPHPLVKLYIGFRQIPLKILYCWEESTLLSAQNQNNNNPEIKKKNPTTNCKHLIRKKPKLLLILHFKELIRVVNDSHPANYVPERRVL